MLRNLKIEPGRIVNLVVVVDQLRAWRDLCADPAAAAYEHALARFAAAPSLTLADVEAEIVDACRDAPDCDAFALRMAARRAWDDRPPDANPYRVDPRYRTRRA